MKVWLTPIAAEDLQYWQSNNQMMAHRIERTLRQLAQPASVPRHQISPLALGYPRLLSVRISPEHRVVFEQLDGDIIVHQCRYHY